MIKTRSNILPFSFNILGLKFLIGKIDRHAFCSVSKVCIEFHQIQIHQIKYF